MLKFGHEITWVAITNIQSLLASHLVDKDMLAIDVTIYSSTAVHTMVPVTWSKVHM